MHVVASNPVRLDLPHQNSSCTYCNLQKERERVQGEPGSQLRSSYSAASSATAKSAATAPAASPKQTAAPSRKETEAAITIQAAARGRAVRRGTEIPRCAKASARGCTDSYLVKRAESAESARQSQVVNSRFSRSSLEFSRLTRQLVCSCSGDAAPPPPTRVF